MSVLVHQVFLKQEPVRLMRVAKDRNKLIYQSSAILVLTVIYILFAHPNYKDINECDEFDTNRNSPCDPLATCENLPGNYTCTCPDGYQGD